MCLNGSQGYILNVILWWWAAGEKRWCREKIKNVGREKEKLRQKRGK